METSPSYFRLSSASCLYVTQRKTQGVNTHTHKHTRWLWWILWSGDQCWDNGFTVAPHTTGIHESVVVPARSTHTSGTEAASSARRALERLFNSPSSPHGLFTDEKRPINCMTVISLQLTKQASTTCAHEKMYTPNMCEARSSYVNVFFHELLFSPCAPTEGNFWETTGILTPSCLFDMCPAVVHRRRSHTCLPLNSQTNRSLLPEPGAAICGHRFPQARPLLRLIELDEALRALHASTDHPQITWSKLHIQQFPITLMEV